MITLSFDTQAVQTLVDVLDGCMSDLREEIHQTHDAGYKDVLKHRRESLRALREKLNESLLQLAEPAD